MFNFKDIDELLNYINDEKDSKKIKKKHKKNKKNKKQNNNNNNSKKEKKEEEIIITNKNDTLDVDKNLDDDFEKEYEIFKRDIEQNTINKSDIKKAIPCLSNDFITNLSD